MSERHDIVIVGAGQAGLTLSRHLLLDTDRTILHLERMPSIPGPRQKVGESSVQLGAHYLGKIIDLEEYLLHEHFMKYNLRFMHRRPGTDGSDFAHFTHSFIRPFSNIPCYQIDRNTLEVELQRLNESDPRYQLVCSAKDIEAEWGEGDADHQVRFSTPDGKREVACRWVIDTTGRSRWLARTTGLVNTPIFRHDSSFFWIDGLVDLDKLTRRDFRERRSRTERRALGHLPFWLATNHFMGDGYWFWLIPLRGRTSFGLVYDPRIIDPEAVRKETSLREWLAAEIPCVSQAIEDREWIDFSVQMRYPQECETTISPRRWAISGVSGRFLDPLYSPGADAIALYNTLIVDAIGAREEELVGKCNLHEQTMQAFHRSFLPTYKDNYGTLGDQEAFYLKYVWELAVYFSIYVFPFINELVANRVFMAGYFRRITPLGQMNAAVQAHLIAYRRWKAKAGWPAAADHMDFMAVDSLKRSEQTFYEMDLDPKAALAVLDRSIADLENFARFIITHIEASVSGDDGLYTDRSYVDSISWSGRDLETVTMQMTQRRPLSETEPWPFTSVCPKVARGLRESFRPEPAPVVTENPS